jgi:hypothetical protein
VQLNGVCPLWTMSSVENGRTEHFLDFATLVRLQRVRSAIKLSLQMGATWFPIGFNGASIS